MSAIERVPRERPIIFGGASVRAILEGRKTQTRRLVKGEQLRMLHPDMFVPEFVASPANRDWQTYGSAGDRLWVREGFAFLADPITAATTRTIVYRATDPAGVEFRVDGDGYPVENRDGSFRSPWSSPVFMPRAASRILLEVRAVRIERLHAITPADAIAEGAIETGDPSPHRRWSMDPRSDLRIGTELAAYAQGWETLHGKGSWRRDDPWVWVIDFARISP